MRFPWSWLCVCLILVHLFVGCSLTRNFNAGDASVTEVRSGAIARTISPGVIPKRSTELTFPAVILARSGTTTFRVRGYPPEMAPSIRLELPKDPLMRGRNDDEVLPWYRCTLRVSAKTTDGTALTTQRIRLGELPMPGSDTYSRGTYQPNWGTVFPLYRISKAIRGRADYNIVVAVEEPSSSPTDAVRLTGESAKYL